jgi:hypothetical protein
MLPTLTYPATAAPHYMSETGSADSAGTDCRPDSAGRSTPRGAAWSANSGRRGRSYRYCSCSSGITWRLYGAARNSRCWLDAGRR